MRHFYENAMGVLIYTKIASFCVLCAKNGEKFSDVFGVSTHEITRLRDTLVSHSVCEVCMESTSIYWIPIWIF